MPGVTELDITYAAALAPAGFHRVVKPDGLAAELNKGKSPPSYLWFHEDSGRGDPIVEIDVIGANDPVPAGFVKLSKSVLKSGTNSCFLCFRRSKEVDPIANIMVVHGSAETPDGYIKIDKNINPTGNVAIFLCVKHGSKDEPEKWSAHNLKVEEWLDCKDYTGAWRVAQVIGLDDLNIRVHFKGWGAKWDENIPKGSSRLAEIASKTAGKDTGGTRREFGQRWALGEEQVAEIMGKLRGTVDEVMADEKFWRGELPAFLEQCLTSTFEDVGVVPLVYEFMHRLITLIVEEMASPRPLPPNSLLSLKRLLFEEQSCYFFFEKYGLGTSGFDDGLREGDGEDDGDYATVYAKRRANIFVSKLYIGNLNHFGRSGGYDHILTRLSTDREVPVPLSEVSTYMGLLRRAMFLQTPAFCDNWFPLFDVALLRRLSNLTVDDMKSFQDVDDLGAVTTILRDYEQTLPVILRNFPVNEKIERFRLVLNKKLLISPLLNIRIRAMQQMIELVEMAVRKDSKRSSLISYYTGGGSNNNNNNNRKEPVAQWLTCQYLAEWFQQDDFLYIALGDVESLARYNLTSTHVEIVRRTEDCLGFIAERNGLTQRHLDLLWRLAKANNGCDEKVVFKILVTLCSFLEEDFLIKMLESMRAVSIDSYSPCHLELIRSISCSCVKSHKNAHDDFGLDLLWAASQFDYPLKSAGSGTDEDIALVASESVAVVLSIATAAKVLIPRYVRRCMDCVNGGGRQASMAIRTLTLIMDAQTERLVSSLLSTSTVSKQSIIEGIENQAVILPVVTASALRLIGHAHELLSAGTVNASTLLDYPLENGRFTYKTCLSIRLDYIKFIVSNTSIELSFEQLDNLWNVLVRPGVVAESSLFLAWLCPMIPEESGQRRSETHAAIGDDCVRRMYVELMSSDGGGLSMIGLGEDGYLSIEKAFRYLCYKDGKMSQSANRNYCQTESVDQLPLLDGLIRVVLDCDEPLLVKCATEFLVGMFNRLGARVDRKTAWGGFSQKIMALISAANVACTSTLTDVMAHHRQTRKRRLNRLLDLLVAFFDEVTKSQTASYNNQGAYNPMQSRPNEQRITTYVRRDNQPGFQAKPPFVYVFRKGFVTVGGLRTRIAKDCKVDPKLVRLQNTSRTTTKASHHDALLLDKAGFQMYADAIILAQPEDDTIGYLPVPAAKTIDADVNSDCLYPRRVITDEQRNLDLLFTLLGDADIMDSAWKLLEKVPVNDGIKTELYYLGNGPSVDISTVESVDWRRLLNPASILALLYRLRIMKTFLVEAADIYESIETKRAGEVWRSAFARTGGVKHLLGVMMSMDVEAAALGGISKVCLASLLSIITEFVVANEDANEDELEDVEVSKMVRQSSGRKDSHAAAKDEGDSSAAGDAKPVLVAESKDQGAAPGTEMPRPVAKVAIIPTMELFRGIDLSELGRRLISMVFRVSQVAGTLTETKTSDEEEKAKEKRRKMRHARYEEFVTKASSGPMKSTAMDALDIDAENDTQEENEILTAEAQVVQSVIALLVALTQVFPHMIWIVLDFQELADSISFGLYKTHESSLRKVVLKGILKICRIVEASLSPKGKSAAGVFARILFPLIDDCARRHEATSTEFFFLLSKLSGMKSALDDVDIEATAYDIASRIVSRPTKEVTEDDSDVCLRGLLTLMRGFLSSLAVEDQDRIKVQIARSDSATNLAYFLFHNCLFANPTDAQVVESKTEADDVPLPKCKSAVSRVACFLLLAEIGNNCASVFDEIASLVTPHHELGIPATEMKKYVELQDELLASNKDTRVSRERVSTLSSYAGQRGRQSYAGLRNMGCICYMNSVVQQLFMTPRFRAGILGFDGDDVDAMTSSDKTESLMFQIQRMFSHLQDSERGYYDPTGFCHAFKDWDGNPTDSFIQQDASEFITNFFTQLEGVVMGSSSENLLRDVFGGTLCNELMADKFYSERSEPFYFISVPALGKRNLLEGLECFIAGETLDYTWDTTNEKGEPARQSIPTVKRVSLKHLPNHLILHLKRFEFDFENMQQAKINEKYDFPLTLDLYPFTIDGRREKEGPPKGGQLQKQDSQGESSEHVEEVHSPDYYKYELGGIVVHMGSAQSGHYYSYIKERSGEGRWFEFNDTLVMEFDEEDIGDECFGGKEEIWGYRGGGGGSGNSQSYVREKIRNAFVLVYDRIPQNDEERRQKMVSKVRHAVPQYFIDEIMQDNVSFWRAKNIFDSRYYDFIGRALSLPVARIDNIPSLQVTQLLCSFSLGTLLAAQDKLLAIEWMDKVRGALTNNYESCRWFMDSISREPVQYKLFTIDTEEKDLRRILAELINLCIRTVVEHDYDSIVKFCDTAPSTLDDLVLTVDPSTPQPLRLIDTAMAVLNHAYFGWRRIAAFFEPIYQFTCLGSWARKYFIRRGYFARMLSFFLQSDSPYPELVLMRATKENEHLYAQSEGNSTASVTSLFGAICNLARSVRLPKEVRMLENDVVRDFEVSHIDLSTAIESSDATLGHCHSVQAVAKMSCPLLPMEPIGMRELEMLSHAGFVTRVLNQMGDASSKRTVGPLIIHLATNRWSSTLDILDVAISTIRKEDYPDLKEPFRAIMMLLAPDDELSEVRTANVMRHVVSEIQNNGRFVLATEMSMECMVRIAKRFPRVRQFLASEEAKEYMAWAEGWLNDRAGNAYPRGAVMSKPRMMGSMVNRVSSNEQRFTQAFGATLVKSLASGAELPDTYDSDDDWEEIVGKSIYFKYNESRFTEVKVLDYNSEANTHLLQFSPTEEKWMRLCERTWRYKDEPMPRGLRLG